MPDDIPSLADLRRTHTRKPKLRSATPATPTSPSLFDAAPNVTTADILAEQSRSLSAPPKSKLPPPSPDPSPTAQVFTVGDLVRHIRNLVERTHGQVTVEGEISNWRPAASGHCYFTLRTRKRNSPSSSSAARPPSSASAPRTATPSASPAPSLSTNPAASSSS